MIDIHTHLYMPQFDDDRDEAIKRAFDAGITMMISVSTEPADHRQAIAITEKDDQIFASVGLHPHYFNEQKTVNNKQTRDNNSQQLTKDIAELRKLAQNNPKIIAIGECGLDYFSHTDELITDEQKAWQKEGFRAQIGLARELGLPVIIHCRDAYEDVFEIIRQESGETKFILHCYMGDTEVTKKFLTLPNVYFSFTGNITYAVKKVLEGTKDDIRETVKRVPLERMLTETDCPFLAPMPHRGKRNEPMFVNEVVKKIAEIHECSFGQVGDATQKSLDRIFTIEISMI